jgi:hypothetical protein
MDAQARTSAAELQTLGRLLSAAQAALFLESLEDGEPVLPVTMAATARLFDARHGHDAGAAQAAYAAYAEARRRGHQPPASPIAELRRRLLGLRVYDFEVPSPRAGVVREVPVS